MTPVTDPNLIAQLEGNASTMGNLKPVTDPAILAQLEGNQSQQNPSFIQQMADSAPVSEVLGIGDEMANLMSQGLVRPQTSSGGAYDVGKTAADIGGFFTGGGVLNDARKVAEGLPLVGPIAKAIGSGQFLPSALRRAIGGGIFGAATNPDDRGEGALKGTLVSAAADALPPVASAIGKAANAIRPQKYAQQILDLMGNGKSLQDNAQSLAQDIKNSYENRVKEGNALYSNIFDNLGSSSVYDGVSPYSSSYQNLDKEVLNSYDRKLNKLHQKFTNDPSLQNAHNLQSQLGSSIRKLQSSDTTGNLSVADRSTMQGYQEAQDAARSDIDNFLSNKGPDLANQYHAATQNWLENVVPYIENSKIAPIAKGDITNPRNISNIFQKPEPEIQKIVEDMGPGATHKILYSELGKYRSSSTPDNLLNAIKGLGDKGLDSYITPSLAQQFDTLAGRVGNRNMAQRGAGALLGISALHPIANSVPVDLLAAAGAGAFSPTAMRYLQNRLPIGKMASAVSDTTPKIYRPLSKAFIASSVPEAQ